MLKLRLQYFSHLMRRTDSLEKTLMLGKIEAGRRRGRQMMRWLHGITNSVDMSLSKLQELMNQGSLVCCSPWGHKELDTIKWLNWTENCSCSLVLRCGIWWIQSFLVGDEKIIWGGKLSLYWKKGKFKVSLTDYPTKYAPLTVWIKILSFHWEALELAIGVYI